MADNKSRRLIGLAFLLTGCVMAEAAAEATLHPLFQNGPDQTLINVVFIAEGYTESELPLFLLHADYTANHLFSGEPFQAYRNYFNAYALSVASAQSGSDHPSKGVFKDTYFNSSYDSYGLAHALTIPPNDRDPDIANGYGKAYSLLNSLLPDWGLLVFIVNDISSGGWGDKRGVVCAANSNIPEVTAHEIGHALAGLGDEYTVSFPGDPEPVAEEPNTTRETSRDFIKWKVWIEDSTPVPTPNSDAFADAVGLFEGARYQSTGWYRPKFKCRMNSMGDPFCEVCTEELVKSIYRRTGAIGAISPESDQLLLADDDVVTLSVSPMQPAMGTVQVDWFIDGRKVAQDSTSLQLSRANLGLGTHQVEAIARDCTTWVRSDPDGVLSTRANWRIAVQDFGSDIAFPYLSGLWPGFAGFAISNGSNEPAVLTFEAIGQEGQRLALPTNPQQLTLEPGRQLASVDSELFGREAGVQGWVNLTSSQAAVASLFLMGDGVSRLDGALGSLLPTRRFYFSHVLEGDGALEDQAAQTRLCLINPGNQVATLKLRVRDKNGTVVNDFDIALSPRGSLVARLADLSQEAVPVDGYIEAEVISEGAVTGFEWIDFPNAKTSVALNALSPTGSRRLFSAQLAGGRSAAGRVFTRLKIINTSDEERLAAIRMISDEGWNLTDPIEVSLAAGKVWEQEVSSMFQGDELIVGSIIVEADGPGLVGSVLFGDRDSLRYAAGLPLQHEPFARAVFNQVANGMGLFTGLALLNPGIEDAHVKLEVFEADGQLTGSVELLLSPGQRVSRLLEELVPATRGQIRGYLVVGSTQPLVAQEILGDFDLNYLAAVPAASLERAPDH